MKAGAGPCTVGTMAETLDSASRQVQASPQRGGSQLDAVLAFGVGLVQILGTHLAAVAELPSLGRRRAITLSTASVRPGTLRRRSSRAARHGDAGSDPSMRIAAR